MTALLRDPHPTARLEWLAEQLGDVLTKAEDELTLAAPEHRKAAEFAVLLIQAAQKGVRDWRSATGEPVKLP